MRTKLSISLPFQLEHFARTRVRDGCYSSISEYFRELIRLDQRIQMMNKERLDEFPLRQYPASPPSRQYR